MNKNASARGLSIHAIVYRVLHICHVRSELGELELGAVDNGVGVVARLLPSFHTIALPRLVVREDSRVIFT